MAGTMRTRRLTAGKPAATIPVRGSSYGKAHSPASAPAGTPGGRHADRRARAGAATGLPHGPQAAAAARRAAAAYVDHLSPPPAADRRQDVLLVVSELATNAVRHAAGPHALTLAADHGVLDVAVSDHSATPPHRRRPDRTDGTGGMGLGLIRQLGGALFVRNTRDGKCVHAVLRLRPSPV
ncbi:ATP-binding protein [Streptomyces sp. NPDC049040]|uniref:ATP-binding protein n=1 Tax=Streptomyces sp. NPDC049040 TaxID=3365593 RepID=UPI00371270A8